MSSAPDLDSILDSALDEYDAPLPPPSTSTSSLNAPPSTSSAAPAGPLSAPPTTPSPSSSAFPSPFPSPLGQGLPFGPVPPPGLGSAGPTMPQLSPAEEEKLAMQLRDMLQDFGKDENFARFLKEMGGPGGGGDDANMSALFAQLDAIIKADPSLQAATANPSPPSSSSAASLSSSPSPSSTSASSSSSSASTSASPLAQGVTDAMRMLSDGVTGPQQRQGGGPPLDFNMADLLGDEAKNDPVLKSLLESMGKPESKMELDKMLEGLMTEMMSREFLEEPISQLVDKYPKWMKENEGKVPREQMASYEKQLSCFQRMLVEFKREPQDGPAVMALIQELQLYGQPPDELMQGMGPNHPLFGGGGGGGMGDNPFGQLPPGLQSLLQNPGANPQQMDKECTIM